MKLTALIVVAILACCHGYSIRPPNTEAVCSQMTPNHNVSARSDTPPFTMTLNATEYSPGDVIEVFLNSSGEWFMEGLWVQARTVDCGNEAPAVGTFSVPQGDIFLEPVDCFGKQDNTIRHYSHHHIFNRTFYWKAPSTAKGHVFLRATVVRKLTIFWLNVHSPFIYDRSNSTRSGLSKFPTCGASVNYVAMPMIVGILLAFFLFKN